MAVACNEIYLYDVLTSCWKGLPLPARDLPGTEVGATAQNGEGPRELFGERGYHRRGVGASVSR